MADYRRFGNYVLFEKEFDSSLFSSWRAGEVSQGGIQEHLRIDILSPDLSKNANLAEHWLGHSVSAAKLEHPNLLKEKTLEFEGSLAAIYAYHESYSLEQLFKKSVSEGIPFSMDHALLIAGKMASALNYATGVHQPHALVLPAFINVSAEGDLKMRGFAISHSLREHLSAHPELMTPYANYFPKADHLGEGGLERYAVFAVGALLFEMVTGESFYAPGKVADARMRVSEAESASTDGPIPSEVADLLCRSLDPSVSKAYENTKVLNADMENLLFSGEYSPTTFNLAFFMHSAFREEVEKRSDAIKAEKTATFDAVEQAPPAPVTNAAPTPPVTPPQTSVGGGQGSEPKKSNMGLIGGAIGVVAAIVLVGAYFMFFSGDSAAEKKRLAQQQTLIDSQKESKKASESLQDNRKDIEIQLLKDRLKKQMEAMKVENERLDSEMLEAESLRDENAKEIAQKLEEERKANEEKIAQMKAELELAQKEREAELQRIQDEEEEAARIKAEEEKALLPLESTPTEETATEVDSTPVPVTTTEQPKPTVAPGELLPHTAMDNAAGLEKALNAQNYYTPSRKALTAGILTKRYYAYSFNVVIDEQGKTASCVMDQNPLSNLASDFGMANRATDWAKRLKYQPPVLNGQPSKCKKLVLIHFRIL